MNEFHPTTAAAVLPGRRRADRGLTLVECALTLVIVGVVVTLVLTLDVETVSNANDAVNSQLATMLGNQIMALECLGDLPEGVGQSITKGPIEVDPSDERFADTDRGEFPYRRFTYFVEKTVEEISAETDLAQTPEERQAQAVADGEEPPKTVEVVRIRVIVEYPSSRRNADGGNRDQVILETYVVDQLARQQAAEAATNTGSGTGNR